MKAITNALKRRPRVERWAWALAALTVVLAFVAGGRPSFTNASTNASRPVRGIAAPVIALQTARDVNEVDAILSDVPSPDREVMRIKQYVDFAFAASYCALFGVLGAALARKHPLARGIAVLAAAAALFDVLENLAILDVVDTSLAAVSPDMLSRLRLWSVWKSALHAAAILASGTFYCLNPRWPARSAGLVGLTAAVFLAMALRNNPLLEWASPALTTALSAQAVTLKFFTHEPAS